MTLSSPAGVDPAPPAAEPLYCANHPNVETLLRCNRCGKPICTKCAKLTDVGYRCEECIRGVQAAYFNAKPADDWIAFGTALAVTLIATPIASIILGFVPRFFSLIVALMVGGGAGSALAQIVRQAVGRRRSRNLRYYALGGVIIGLLAWVAAALFGFVLVLNLPFLLFAVLAAAATVQLLR